MIAPHFLSSFPRSSDIARAGIAPCFELPPCRPQTHGGELPGGRPAYRLAGADGPPKAPALGGVPRRVQASAPDPGRGTR